MLPAENASNYKWFRRGRAGNPGHGQVEPREGEIDIDEMRRLLPEFKGKQ
jgi:hypothetical protein